MDLMRQFWRGEEGADASEYALLAALIAVAIISGASSWTGSLAAFFVDLRTTVDELPRP